MEEAIIAHCLDNRDNKSNGSWHHYSLQQLVLRSVVWGKFYLGNWLQGIVGVFDFGWIR